MSSLMLIQPMLSLLNDWLSEKPRLVKNLFDRLRSLTGRLITALMLPSRFTFCISLLIGEKLLQHGSDGRRVYVVRLAVQCPALRMREGVRDCLCGLAKPGCLPTID